MEILRGQKLIQTRGSTGKSFRSNPFLESNKDKGYVSDLARESTLRGHEISNFSFKIIIGIVMSFLNSPAEIRENSMKFSMETEFFEFFPELADHFEIFSKTLGFNVTIVTSAKTQDETLPPWSGFLKKKWNLKKRKDWSWNPTSSWNKELAHTRFLGFQKKSIHQLRFLGFLFFANSLLIWSSLISGVEMNKGLGASNPKKWKKSLLIWFISYLGVLKQSSIRDWTKKEEGESVC